ncbi:MAG: Uma2 family endonuclease [Caldilineaceae bacterium]
MLATQEATGIAKTYTVAEFDEFRQLPANKNRLFELINGEIVEKMPTEQHGVIALNIGSELRAYAKQHKTGQLALVPSSGIPR